jgi:hypothetical protein
MIKLYLLIFAPDAHVKITQASCRIVSGSIFLFLSAMPQTSISAAVLLAPSKIFVHSISIEITISVLVCAAFSI